MKDYERPVVLATEEVAEGVYAGSGTDCYTVRTNIHQEEELGRENYVVQVDGTHAADDDHHSSEQRLILTFNQPVVYLSSAGVLEGYSDGNFTIIIKYEYHNNGNEDIGLGNVCVEATTDVGLEVSGATLTCNCYCSQH